MVMYVFHVRFALNTPPRVIALRSRALSASGYWMIKHLLVSDLRVDTDRSSLTSLPGCFKLQPYYVVCEICSILEGPSDQWRRCSVLSKVVIYKGKL